MQAGRLRSQWRRHSGIHACEPFGELMIYDLTTNRPLNRECYHFLDSRPLGFNIQCQ